MNYRGMGGVVTNVVDLWEFHRALNDGKLVSQQSLDEMWATNSFGYGLGWQLKPGPNDSESVGHGGAVRGFSTNMRLYPKKKLCLFVLANSNEPVNFEVFNRTEEILRGQEPLVPLPPDKEKLSRYVGTYRSGGRVLTLLAFHSGSEFMPASINWGGPVTRGLLCNNADGDVCFFDGQTMEKIVFELDDEGLPTSCQIGDTKFEK